MSVSCGLTAKLVLTATLLGSPGLFVERPPFVSASQLCGPAVRPHSNSANLANSPNSADNALLILKDERGRSLYKTKWRVNESEFYDTPNQRGGVPAITTSFVLSYPFNFQTARARSVELRLLNHKYDQSASLPIRPSQALRRK
jgi:hypothetical protein